MKQSVIFDRNTVTGQLQGQLYAWSRQYNIVFVENNTVDGVVLNFGRESDLTVFLMTWPERRAQPRVR